jgi:hypothetical protein
MVVSRADDERIVHAWSFDLKVCPPIRERVASGEHAEMKSLALLPTAAPIPVVIGKMVRSVKKPFWFHHRDPWCTVVSTFPAWRKIVASLTW